MAAQEYLCHVKSNRSLVPNVFELAFETDRPVEFKGGQFFSVLIPGAGPNGRDLRRAYSVASAPETRPVELCVKLVDGGPGTEYLNDLKPGDTFKAFAPYGNFFYLSRPDRHAVFIATGTGIAPFRSIVLSDEFRKAPPLSSICLLGVRADEEVLYSKDLDAVPGLKWVPVVSRPTSHWNGFKGRVTDYLGSLDSAFPWKETDFYLCGNGAMINDVKALLTEKGVEKNSIHQEKYY